MQNLDIAGRCKINILRSLTSSDFIFVGFLPIIWKQFIIATFYDVLTF